MQRRIPHKTGRQEVVRILDSRESIDGRKTHYLCSSRMASKRNLWSSEEYVRGKYQWRYLRNMLKGINKADEDIIKLTLLCIIPSPQWSLHFDCTPCLVYNAIIAFRALSYSSGINVWISWPLSGSSFSSLIPVVPAFLLVSTAYARSQRILSRHKHAQE